MSQLERHNAGLELDYSFCELRLIRVLGYGYSPTRAIRQAISAAWRPDPGVVQVRPERQPTLCTQGQELAGFRRRRLVQSWIDGPILSQSILWISPRLTPTASSIRLFTLLIERDHARGDEYIVAKHRPEAGVGPDIEVSGLIDRTIHAANDPNPEVSIIVDGHPVLDGGQEHRLIGLDYRGVVFEIVTTPGPGYQRRHRVFLARCADGLNDAHCLYQPLRSSARGHQDTRVINLGRSREVAPYPIGPHREGNNREESNEEHS
jgi:hypothetical protein